MPSIWTEEMAQRQERLRALWIIEKAQRNSEDPAKSMSLHGVNRALIQELAGSLPVMGRKNKRNKEDELYAWVADNVNKNITVQDLVDFFKVSMPTGYKMIREHPDCFFKISRGAYTVRDGRAERANAKSNKVDN